MTNIETETAKLSAAVAARKDSLTELRKRIIALCEPIPVGATLRDEAGVICTVAAVYTGASQWSNRRWERIIRGWGLIADGKLVAAALEDSLWDGRNMHYHSDEPICLDEGSQGDLPAEEGKQLRYMSGADTRAIAARLPGGIAAYIQRCGSEAAANAATLQAAAE
jgi:hypothetical protein